MHIVILIFEILGGLTLAFGALCLLAALVVSLLQHFRQPMAWVPNALVLITWALVCWLQIWLLEQLEIAHERGLGGMALVLGFIFAQYYVLRAVSFLVLTVLSRLGIEGAQRQLEIEERDPL